MGGEGAGGARGAGTANANDADTGDAARGARPVWAAGRASGCADGTPPPHGGGWPAAGAAATRTERGGGTGGRAPATRFAATFRLQTRVGRGMHCAFRGAARKMLTNGYHDRADLLELYKIFIYQ